MVLAGTNGSRCVCHASLQLAHLLMTPGAQHAQPATSPFFFIARPIFSILAVPIHILSSIVRFIFGLLRIPVPQFHLRFVGLNFYRNFGGSRTTRRGPGHSETGPERWIRELEEETGAVCIGRIRNSEGMNPGAASSAIEAGPSNLTARGALISSSINGYLDEGRKVLPDFMLGSYEEMLRICKKDARIGCVILVSEEHDDVPEFKRCVRKLLLGGETYCVVDLH